MGVALLLCMATMSVSVQAGASPKTPYRDIAGAGLVLASIILPPYIARACDTIVNIAEEAYPERTVRYYLKRHGYLELHFTGQGDNEDSLLMRHVRRGNPKW